ncbi:fibrinogen-like protein A [Saccostrea cucullata]|uniref:fibrinogen-like protein A n=1 Tax=Saccostrea cuccullata TaxID=36930 RepID=UPI002ED03E6F
MEVKCFRGHYHMWTVIQRRFDGSVLFNRSWSEYKAGFGSLDSEFWLGNDNIHDLTKNGLTYMRVDLMNSTGGWNYAEYSRFSVDSEENKYNLTITGHSGGLRNDLDILHGMFFSTHDVDNDLYIYSCASNNKGGWWFHECFKANLNGEYGSSVKWRAWTTVPLKETRMMIREP